MKKDILKSSIRNTIDGILIFLLFITTTVYALPSNGVIYDNTNSGSTATNVNDALDDLYTKVNAKQTEIDRINGIGDAGANHILNGKTAYVKGATVTGTIPSKGAATYTPGTSNQTIASGNYLSGNQTIKGDANLVAGNIAKGKTIFGVEGSYTSDANAVAGNILKDKTAYVNGSKITGTIPSKGAATYTPNTKNQTIASGNYLSGVQTIKGDANLVAGNIAKGKTIFGVAGTYTSDANAAAGNILSGKTAYVNGNKITGSMPSRNGSSEATTVAKGSNGNLYMVFPHGYYPAENHFDKANSSEVFISPAKVASAIGLTADKLATGQNILGVTGTYTGKNLFQYLLTMGYSGNWNDSKSWTATENSVVIVIAYCNVSVTVNGAAKSSNGTWAHQPVGGIFHFTVPAGQTLTVSGSGGGGTGAIAYRIA